MANNSNNNDPETQEEEEPFESDEIAIWEELTPANPVDLSAGSGFHGHSCVFYDNKLWIFGGAAHGWSRKDLYVFDLESHEWKTVYPVGKVPESSDHCAVEYRNKMYIFGGRGHACRRDGVNSGQRQPIYNDLYSFDFETWQWKTLPQRGDVPGPRKAFSAVLFEERMFIFGGWNNDEYYNDLFYLDLEEMTWTRVAQQGDIPSVRHDHTMVLYQDKLILWGGCGGYNNQTDRVIHYHEIHEFDIQTDIWKRIPFDRDNAPYATEGHQSLVVGDHMYVFGGHNGFAYFNYLYRLNLKNYKWTRISLKGKVPAVRACFAWHYIPREQLTPSRENNHTGRLEDFGNKAILIGGYGPFANLEEAYELDQRGKLIYKDIFHRYRDIYLTLFPPPKEETNTADQELDQPVSELAMKLPDQPVDVEDSSRQRFIDDHV